MRPHERFLRALDVGMISLMSRKDRAPYVRGALREEKARELATRVFGLGEPPGVAGGAIGLTFRQVERLVRHRTYLAERDEILTRRDRARSRLLTTSDNVLEETERRIQELGARAVERLEGILADSVNEAVVAKVASDVLDRLGFRAPTRTETKAEIRLSPDTVALLASVTEEIRQVDAIDLEKSDWSYAVSATGSQRDPISQSPSSATRRR